MEQDATIADVRARRRRIAQQMEANIAQNERLRAEDERLRVAEEVLLELARRGLQDLDSGEPPRATSAAPSGTRTFRDSVLSVMRNSGRTWWTAVDLAEELRKVRGEDVPRRNLSPKLTAMKEVGDIVRRGRKIALPERAEAEPGLLSRSENEEPSGSSEANAESTDPAPGVQDSPPSPQGT